MSKAETLQQRVLPYFIAQDNDRYMCTLCVPPKPINGKFKPNLVTHIRKSHKEVFINHSPNELLKYSQIRLEKIQGFSEMVAVNGRPFNALLDCGLHRVLRNEFQELNSVGHGITLDKNLKEVKEYIQHIAVEVRNKIKNELKNVFVSLLLDIGTKNRNSILGICLQYMQSDTVKNITVGMVPLSQSHKAPYIVETLLNCLKIYDIQFQHIFAMVSDNAANMIAATKQLENFILADQIQTEENDSVLPEFNNNQNLSEQRQQEILDEINEMQQLSLILCEEDNYEQLFEEVIGELSKHTTLVITIRCAAHSIQLAVRDAIKISSFKSILTLCKYITQKLHTQEYKYTASQANIKFTLPHMSCDTRWDADYDMVK